MRKFYAKVRNEEGLTFLVWFFNENWCGIEDAAKKALDAVVAADPLHQANAPFSVIRIDVAA